MRIIVSSLALLITSALWAAPQRPPGREITVLIVDAHLNPAQPVQNVRVSLTYLESGRHLDNRLPSTEAKALTNRGGQVVLQVSTDAEQSGTLRIEIVGAGDLRVYQPYDGQLTGLPAHLTIQMLPKGSPLLMGDPAQIEALLRRASFLDKQKITENRSLRRELAGAQNSHADLRRQFSELQSSEAALKRQLTEEQGRNADLSEFFDAWARDNGFASEEVGKRIHQWAQEIEQHKEQARAEQRALAELALEHYREAAQSFERLFEMKRTARKDKEKRQVKELRDDLQQSIRAVIQSANSYQRNYRYHDATHVLGEALDDTAEAHRRYSEDGALRSIWLGMRLRAADAQLEEAKAASGADIQTLLESSANSYRSLLKELATPDDQEAWATAQNNLGNALFNQAQRAEGSESLRLFAESSAAYQHALDVRTKESMVSVT